MTVKIGVSVCVCMVMTALSLTGIAAYAQEAQATQEVIEAPGTATQEGMRTFTRQYRIYFRMDKWEIDTTYKDNGASLERMKAELDSLIADKRITTDSIYIVSAASPDGGSAYNYRLSQKRGLSAASLLKSLYKEINPDIIIQNPIGEDWSSLRNIAIQDENLPQREALLALIDSELSEDEKERRLKAMRPTFNYILRNHIHIMRSAAVSVNILLPEIKLDPVTTMPAPRLEARTGGGLVPVQKGTSYQQQGGSSLSTKPFTTTKMIFALRTNLLVPALNVGIEVPIKTNWSVGADYYFPWWLAGSNKYCAEMLGWFIDGKYWFGKNRTEEDKLTGHAVGLYAGGGYYDFQWLRDGRQGEFIDVGIDYTYAIPLAKGKLRMEFNIGIGWVGTRTRHYTMSDDWADLIREPGVRWRDYNFFGPTRASVSLVVPIKVKVKAKEVNQ